MDATDPKLQEQLRELITLDSAEREHRLTQMAAGDQAAEQSLRSALASLLAATLDTFAWGEIYQVATGQSMTLNGVLDALASVSPQPLQRSYEAPRTGDIVHSSGSSDKLQRLGWRPTVPLADGLAELVRPAAS